jgi:hypothetical protein
MARSHGVSQPKARPKADQKVASRKVVCTGIIIVEWVSVRVHAEYSLFAPLYATVPLSDASI